MRRGIWRAAVLALLVECVLAFGATASTPGLTPAMSSSDPPVFRTYLLQSAGALGVGTGCAAIALPLALAYYLFSPGQVAPVVGAEGVFLGLGSAIGACWTGRSLGQPAKFWPALGLAFLPEVGTALVMGLTRKGADLTDPLIMGCCGGAILASPILAALGANLGRRGTATGTSSRFQLVPELRVCSNHQLRLASGNPHTSAGLGLRLSF
jgi:hypothetical protein